MTIRQENALKTRQKLMDTTDKLIHEKGFYKLCVEDITKAAGVAKGTFYIYFKHKEDIVIEICKNLFNETKLKIESLGDVSVENRLECYFESFLLEVIGYKIHIVREWIKGLVELKPQGESMGQIKWHYDFEMLKSIIDEAVNNKELKEDTPVDFIVNNILTQLYGMITVWCMSNSEFNPTDWIKKFSRIQINAILSGYKLK